MESIRTEGAKLDAEEAQDRARLDVQDRARSGIRQWDTDAILASIDCTRPGTWLAAVLRAEMANRGLGATGEWVGFPRAAVIWSDTPFQDLLDKEGA